MLFEDKWYIEKYQYWKSYLIKINQTKLMPFDSEINFLLKFWINI
jgi:hypothetical protein